ncbi:MAG: hypothetical protein OXG04_20395 [Acidobacteria bacterium]|nr:hypothetical protein [Acidobacteriota bacterium]
MFDTLAVSWQLAGGGGARNQAEVIAKAIHHLRPVQAGLAEVRAEIANLDAPLSTE